MSQSLTSSHALRARPLALAIGLAFATAPALAAMPDAGQILQEPRGPAPTAAPRPPALTIDSAIANAVPEGGSTVRLSAIRLQGNTVFSTPALQALLADAMGRDLSFADLTRLAERVTRHYRDAGYLVARAYLPAQQLQGGELQIAVLEGNLGEIVIRNPSQLGGSALAPLGQLPLNAPLHGAALDQALLTLAELPGTGVQSTLRPGAAVGASDLLVEITRARAFEGGVDLDNFGSLYTGEYRVGTSLYWNNPADRGDQLSLRLQASDARLHYERLAYQLPVGTWATRVGVAVSNMQYRLGKEFDALDADGSASVASLYLRQPLLRSVGTNWYAQLQYDAKRLRDSVGSAETTSRQRLHNVVLGLNGDWQDRWLGSASSALAVNLTAGRLSLDADSAALDAASARSAGHFMKLETQLQRVQALAAGWSLALNVRGQAANGNLASVEKMSLGGSQGVRAYAQGEALGDSGWLTSAELRWRVAPGWQVQAFGDAGGVKVSETPWTAGSNHRNLQGAGVGATWTFARTAISLTAAWPIDRDATALQSDRKPRFWGQASLAF